MNEIVYCLKLKKDGKRLSSPPYPGPLGEKIYQNICEEAWQAWLAHQTMLINEYRLSLIDPKSREFLVKEMDKFLFGDGSEKPAGFVPESHSK